MTLIAELLIDLTSLHTTTSSEQRLLEQAICAQQAAVRQREHACVQALLALFRFRQDDYLANPLPISDGRLTIDLFNPQALKDMGLHMGKGVAAGVVAGAVADVLSAGLSLGTGMLVGAIAGGATQGFSRLGTRMLSHFRGFRELTVQDEVLQFVRLRQVQLLAALERRGHASVSPVQLNPQEDKIKDLVNRFPKPLRQARAHPEWSSVGSNFQDGHARQRAILALAKTVSIDAEWRH
jgi:hypothetical protein